MEESMKVDNLCTLHQIIEDVLRETVKDISRTDLNEIIKTAVWKPDKDNKSVQRFISRMRDRHTREEADAKRVIKKGLTPDPYLYQIPEPGERFEYVVVENNSSERVGDKMEYPEPSSEIVLKALKKLKDSNKAGENKVDDNKTIISHLWEGARIYAKKLFDTTYADKGEHLTNNSYYQSFLNALDKQEEFIRLKLSSLLKEIFGVDIGYRESMYKLVTKKRAMSLEQYLISYYLDECKLLADF
ncbi:hypothetical protein C1645_841268 [Glomus cerebriforme]|uniref:DNA-directed DNA polymerase n=1 Tax=Glomus cerebriforme TaxID=658196 RepID=A0A397S4C1_9GLOM|nr:hypothetical protein C1645_841268 [Glomus cerebriforme]